MTKTNKALSLVIPLFNEELVVESLVEELNKLTLRVHNLINEEQTKKELMKNWIKSLP